MNKGKRSLGDLIWRAKCGILHGQAWQQIAFLRGLLEESGTRGLEPMGMNDSWPWARVIWVET